MEPSVPGGDKELEDIKKDEKVKRALSENSISVQMESEVVLEKEAPLLGITAILFVSCGVLYFLLGWNRLPISSICIPLAQKIVLAVMLISLVLLACKPYEVGDRIRIGNVYGDVINVSYIDTTLWESKGDYLSTDHPSGRIIRFANSKVFSEYVYNYSWPLFPFI